jgi:hypothetical protein
MTALQRRGTDSGTATLPAPTKAGANQDRTHTFSWDEWFRHASLQQRAAALGLAHQQGILYPQQLPAVTNGVKPIVVVAKDTDASLRLADLFANKSTDLASFEDEPLLFVDTELDAIQQQAVIRAIATPDVFLLRGFPGTGKSRVIAETIAQSALRGRRVLLVGSPASLDVVLERLSSSSAVLPLRYLDATEKADALPAWLRAMTMEEQKRSFLDRLQQGIKTNREQAETACRSRQDGAALWATLQARLEQYRDAAARLDQLNLQSTQLAAAIEQEADTAAADSLFATKLAEWRQNRDAALKEMDVKLAALQQTQAQCDKESAELATKVAALEPTYQAKKNARFWSMIFWTNGHVIAEMEALLAQQTQAQARCAAAVQECAEAATQRQAVLDRFAVEKAAFLGSEIDQRSLQLQKVREPLQTTLRQIDEEWQTLCSQLGIGTLDKTAESVASAHQSWQLIRQRDEEQCQFAQQWSAFIEASGADFVARLPGYANLLAGSSKRWLNDAKLRESVNAPVDLVIIEDADTLTESDIQELARLGRRSMLVSQSLEETFTNRTYDRLWQTLGGKVEVFPCSWRREAGRLICQLTPLSAADQQYLERECVADAPDIELAILQRPYNPPALAQVVFGAKRSFADAFQFLIREVQEFPLVPAGRTKWWTENADQVQLCFGCQDLVAADSGEIEPGIHVASITDANAIKVAAITFVKSAGWDRPKAAAWLNNLRRIDLHERTVFLGIPHRSRPPLAALLDTFTADALTLMLTQSGRPVEFIPVPALPKKDWPREGAGLELDLSTSRMADRLPVGLRQGLPARGYVNYVEAQALIRRLETFSQRDVNGQPVSVLATALYESQVELLRRLATQSEILRNARFPLEIALPSRLRQREFDVVFLSLTRSNDQRPVAFGQDLDELPLALTRARTRLFVFGDPGTLGKRVQSSGIVETWNADQSARELARMAHLLSHLQRVHEPVARVAV